MAVLDGHGEQGLSELRSLFGAKQGKRVSEFARTQLAKNLYASKVLAFSSGAQPTVPFEELYTKPAIAMENAYAETQRGIERSHTIDAQRSGTTAVACYRHRDHLVVANVGDSRAVLGRCSSREGEARGLRAVDLSSDQRPMREDERMRIVQQAGEMRCAMGVVRAAWFTRAPFR